MARLSLFPAFVSFLLLGGAVQAQTPSATLQKAFDDYFAWRMREYPQSATVRGFHDHDDRLDRYSLDAFREQKDMVQSFLNDVANIDESALTIVQKRDLQVFRKQLQQFVDGYQFAAYGQLNPVNFLGGIHRETGWVSSAKFETEADYAKYASRLEELPVQLANVTTLMRHAISLQRANHEVSMTGVPDQIDALIKPANESLFFMPYREKLDQSSVPGSSKTQLIARGNDLLAGVNNAFTALKNFIETEYMNNTRAAYGVGTFTNGQAYYQECLKFHLSSDKTPQQVHNDGLREVGRISSLMQGIMQRNGFSGTIPQFVQYLQANRSAEFYGRTSEQLLQGYRDMINIRIAPLLRKIATVVEDAPCMVKPTQYDGPSGMYGSNTFWANVFRAETRPTYAMMALTLHEASPGHHLQISVARQQSSPDFRRRLGGMRYYAVPFNYPWYTAYSEGWALYAEYLGEDMGVFNEEALEMFGRYSSEIFRACRMVVDTGIHAMGWSMDDAVNYLANYTAIPRGQIVTEIRRYITWPGQACAYKQGELELKRMREKSANALGDRFDIRYFNDVVLKAGRMPLNVLEQVVDEYIAVTTSAATEPQVALLLVGIATLLRYLL